MKKMSRLLIIPTFLITILAGSVTQASAQTRTFNRPILSQLQHNENIEDDNNGATTLLKAVVREWFYGTDQILEVKKLVANEYGNLRGEKIQKIILRGNSRYGHGTVELIVNGNSMGIKTLPKYSEQLVFELPASNSNTVGYDISGIKFLLTGNIFVKSVGLKVEN